MQSGIIVYLDCNPKFNARELAAPPIAQNWMQTRGNNVVHRGRRWCLAGLFEELEQIRIADRSFFELNLSLDVMTFSFGTRTTRMLVSIVIAIISKASTHNIRLRSLRSGNNPNRDRGPGGEG
jgi:hypothetical protein